MKRRIQKRNGKKKERKEGREEKKKERRKMDGEMEQERKDSKGNKDNIYTSQNYHHSNGNLQTYAL